jgi:hypothetical protein
MRARRIGLLVICIASIAVSAAVADPKPIPVDIKSFKDKLIVLQDAHGGTYAILYGDDKRIFYGANAKALYEQVVIGSSRNGDAWMIDAWAPRIPDMHPAMVQFKDDRTYFKSCDGKDDAALTQLTGDKAKQVLDHAQFLSTALVYRPHLLARDDSGTYYYVDKIAKQYGGNGYRVWAGKKGGMKQLPLVNVASDTAGEVFSTKTGDLRLVKENADPRATASWIRGDKKLQLVTLDPDANSVVIFRELGIYGFTGTLCDNL